MLSAPERRKTQWQSLWEAHIPVHWQRGCLRCLSSLQRQQGRQPGWLRSAFGCTESVKQSKTQGKSFSRSPAEFALTLPHLVWGRKESGYYEHFLFIKPELQELICLLGKAAEYKAVPCPTRTMCLCRRLPSASGTAALPAPQRGQRPCLDRCAMQDPDFPGLLRELVFGTQQRFTFAPSFAWILLVPRQVPVKNRVFYHNSPAAPFNVEALGWPFPRKQSSPHCCLHKGLHLPRGSDPGS